ncbi:MAG: Type 1 glutamine amidotransferase-like domain-containing protein [Candidatus Nomurabacteria bacterium]|jgi:dipeptidase E|nr:Type 1 glutamine amidotransferase-like domain-containing protein [Candidatus Nomurabacteria bacterium]
MKLLLTSAGITNKTIENELKRLLGKSFDGVRLFFCTSASNWEGGEMNFWLINDLFLLDKYGFKIDICDINGIGIDNFLPRMEAAEVLYFEGGNTQWLRKCIKDSGLEEHLPKLLKSKVWVGASAGSCVLCPTVMNSAQDLFDENVDEFGGKGLGLVDFQFVPHMNNDWYEKVNRDNLQSALKNLRQIDGKKLYAVDDEGAVSVDGDRVAVVSEGEWLEESIGEAEPSTKIEDGEQ